MQSVPIITNVVSLNPAQAKCSRYNIMWWSYYLQQVGGFHRLPPSIKLIVTI